MTATAADAIAWLRAQLGTVEGGGRDGHSGNIVRYWDWYDALTGAHNQGLSWCGAIQLNCDAVIGVPQDAGWPAYVAVETWRKALQRQGRLVDADHALPGDYAFLHVPGEHAGANHMARLVSIDRAHRTATTIDGNTSPGPGHSETNGGGVYQRTRPLSLFVGFGRPRYATTAPVPPLAPSPQEVDMAPLPVTIVDASGKEGTVLHVLLPDNRDKNHAGQLRYRPVPTLEILERLIGQGLAARSIEGKTHQPVPLAELKATADFGTAVA